MKDVQIKDARLAFTPTEVSHGKPLARYNMSYDSSNHHGTFSIEETSEKTSTEELTPMLMTSEIPLTQVNLFDFLNFKVYPLEKDFLERRIEGIQGFSFKDMISEGMYSELQKKRLKDQSSHGKKQKKQKSRTP